MTKDEFKAALQPVWSDSFRKYTSEVSQLLGKQYFTFKESSIIGFKAEAMFVHVAKAAVQILNKGATAASTSEILGIPQNSPKYDSTYDRKYGDLAITAFGRTAFFDVKASSKFEFKTLKYRMYGEVHTESLHDFVGNYITFNVREDLMTDGTFVIPVKDCQNFKLHRESLPSYVSSYICLTDAMRRKFPVESFADVLYDVLTNKDSKYFYIESK